MLGLIAHEPRAVVEQPGQEGMYKTSGTGALSKAYADLDVAYVLGDSAKKVLTEAWPLKAGVHVIPHGDEGIFASIPIRGAADTGPVALSFGTITAYKGIDTLCAACFAVVRTEVPDARLVIAGALSADMDEAQLRSVASGLEGVTLTTGYIVVADVPSYFDGARCVVLPYKRSSRGGPPRSHAAPGRSWHPGSVTFRPSSTMVSRGILVPPDDPAALADALIRLLTDPQLAQAMGEAGAAGWRRRLDGTKSRRACWRDCRPRLP